MGNKILTFKMWEDAAANSVASGGVSMPADAVGKKALLKRKKKTQEKARLQHKTKPGSDWESRNKLQQTTRSDMWKSIIQKGKARLKKRK